MAINENLSEVGEEINMEMDSKDNSPTTPFTGSSVVRKMTREEDDDMNNGNGDETNKKYRKEELEEDSSPKLVFKVQQQIISLNKENGDKFMMYSFALF